ncbi:hypothetical protein KIPB_003862 [Kipferlia bialata]|uniref:Uncharacterized protein n=1 Tax=Kipferlia bialata TaxID=797122 RepID=A0A391NQG8_9EUKA|nr:hypothetical protein KIPB_003862 [Kipferlia bialata]|eukprot:g3862.t1
MANANSAVTKTAWRKAGFDRDLSNCEVEVDDITYLREVRMAYIKPHGLAEQHQIVYDASKNTRKEVPEYDKDAFDTKKNNVAIAIAILGVHVCPTCLKNVQPMSVKDHKEQTRILYEQIRDKRAAEERLRRQLRFEARV